MKSIVLISVYFGKFPYYFSLFKKSAKANKDVDFVIFADEEEEFEEDNIKVIKLNSKQFAELASEKLGLPINPPKPYKLCDFKPAYGKIFEDYFKEYDFWGHSDIDLIWGDIRKFIPDEILEENDIVSANPVYLSGVFSIYKNTERLKNIYKNFRENYDTLIRAKEYEQLDEVDYSIINERIPNLKIFTQHRCGGGKLDLQRHGKDREGGAHWEKGKMIVESYLTDYPGQKVFCGFGAETMFFHVREKAHWHHVDVGKARIDTLRRDSHRCRTNSKCSHEELFFTLSNHNNFKINQSSPGPSKNLDKLILIHSILRGSSPDQAAGKRIHNYFHWLKDCMPHLLNALEKTKDETCKIALFSCSKESGQIHYLNQKDFETKFIKQYIDLLGIEERILPIERLENYEIESAIIYENFHRIQGVKRTPDENIKNIRDFSLGMKDKDFPVYKKIYAARKGLRTISEESESMILSHGFEKLYMEDFSVLEQATIFNNADVIVSPHGAQLANLIFCKDQSRIIELSNGYNYPCFPDTAIKVMGGCYSSLRGNPDNNLDTFHLGHSFVFEEDVYTNFKLFDPVRKEFAEKYLITDPLHEGKVFIPKNKQVSRDLRDWKDRLSAASSSEPPCNFPSFPVHSRKFRTINPCMKRLELVLEVCNVLQ
jgi:hypothetical protein